MSHPEQSGLNGSQKLAQAVLASIVTAANSRLTYTSEYSNVLGRNIDVMASYANRLNPLQRWYFYGALGKISTAFACHEWRGVADKDVGPPHLITAYVIGKTATGLTIERTHPATHSTDFDTDTPQSAVGVMEQEALAIEDGIIEMQVLEQVLGLNGVDQPETKELLRLLQSDELELEV